jgi:hypothetical protein
VASLAGTFVDSKSRTFHELEAWCSFFGSEVSTVTMPRATAPEIRPNWAIIRACNDVIVKGVGCWEMGVVVRYKGDAAKQVRVGAHLNDLQLHWDLSLVQVKASSGQDTTPQTCKARGASGQ